jgi:predicted Zn-dependent protease with MMP-like domain
VNVALVVEEKPSPALLSSLGVPHGETLLGLYDGIPLTERGDWYNLVPPDRIIIFRRPILESCHSVEEIREEVRRTVLHEVAHFYGIGDDELDRMGFS